MKEQSRSQQRQQILTGVGILGGLAGSLALKVLRERTQDVRNSAAEVDTFLYGLLMTEQEAATSTFQEVLSAGGAAPKPPSLPQPGYTEHVAQGPPLRREASDGLTMCYAFFNLAPDIESAHLVPNRAMRERFFQFLQYSWNQLDGNTRNWVLRTPELWLTLQRNWRSMSRIQQNAAVEYYRGWFEWFGDGTEWFARSVPPMPEGQRRI